MTNLVGWTLLVMAATGGPQSSRTTTSPVMPASGLLQISHCQVFLIDDVRVPAQETGALVTLSVEEGAQVRAGELLGQIDDREAQLARQAAERERDAALARATDDIEVRYAEASLAVARAELDQSEDINRRSAGSVAAAELRRLQLTCQRAELQIDRSRLDRHVAQITAQVHDTTVASATESIERRQLIAPFDGVVVERLKHPAEWVNAGEPVLRVIRLDRLRVEGFVDTHELNPEDINGCPVTVDVERAGGRRVQLPGQIMYVSPLVQAGDKYRIRAEVRNGLLGGHWVLCPGMSASMTLHRPNGQSTAGPTPTPARRASVSPAGSVAAGAVR